MADKDPWSGRPEGEGPPDLEDILRKLNQKLKKAFKGKQPKDIFAKAARKSERRLYGLWSLIVLVIIIWFAAGIFIVSPAERAAVLRFGKYTKTVGPGLHWIPRFLASSYVVNVQRISTFPYRAEMLTKDENIVSVELVVQYRVDNVRDYLFNVVEPSVSLQHATASALRQVVGHTTLDEVLTTGRAIIREQVEKQLANILANYNAGLLITDVTLQPAKPPEAVTEAFDDVNRAREDEVRFINQAKAYQQQVVPIAQGKAKRVLKEAEAYKQKVILQANADVTKFLALLPQYEKNPTVTSKRLYLSAIESVLKNTSKILLDKNGNNILYLPLPGTTYKDAKTDSLLPLDAEKLFTQDLTTKDSHDVNEDNRPLRVGYPVKE